MIREKNREEDGIVIDLDGPQGNAFVLLGIAKGYADQMGIDTDQVLGEMKAGDYENLIWVFDQYFGKVVTLERTSLDPKPKSDCGEFR